MTTFVVRHQHPPDRCPARDFAAGAELLNHLGRDSATRHGVRIVAEAVLQGAHTMVMIAEAGDEAALRVFLEPFEQVGTIEVEAAATCASVVANGGCAAAMPALDPLVPAVDPADACQVALDAGLVVHRAHPLNAETSIPALVGAVVMPNAYFYVRNHFQIPDIDASRWRLEVAGEVDRPLSLGLAQLRAMPAETVVVTLECAGNGRAQLQPPVPGEPWRLGAVSTAEWTGVPVGEVLDRAVLKPDARAVLFTGADSGAVDGRPGTISFERSLGLDELREAGAILAFAMNGEALPVQHGYPLRLVVPGWYAVASVKWLTRIDVIGHEFTGYFQTDKYQYEHVVDGRVEREPVTLQQVRSLIVEPGSGQQVDAGEVMVRGVAWSGAAPIASVEVRVGEGPWQRARLIGDRRRGHWQWWQLPVELAAIGPARLEARATDLAARTQPEEPRWNVHGYGNNAVQATTVHVRGG